MPIAKKHPNLTEFVEYLHNGFKRFGRTEIINKVDELYARDDRNDFARLKTKIFEEIKNVTGISHRALIKSNRRGAITEAKVIAILLFDRHTDMSHREIGAMFHRGAGLIGRRIKAFKSATLLGPKLSDNELMFEKTYTSKDFIAKFEQIDNAVVKYKETWKKTRK